MRADRLVAILLLLQQRGQVTAAEVAAELEVSERTARRDLDALGMAGIPVYSLQGRGGGWRLAGGGRTDLSGLTAEEAGALFAVAGPDGPPQVRGALRKVVRALPEPLRAQAEASAASVAVDPTGWDGVPVDTAPPHLEALQRAVVDGVVVRLGYVDRRGSATERRVHPLGLGAKGRVWYLVAGTDAGRRTFRVDRVRSVEPTGDPVERPEGFDLDEVWRAVVDEVEEMRTPVQAHGTVVADLVGPLRWVLGTRVVLGPAVDGRGAVELRGLAVRSLAAEIAGFGAALVVDEPVELRVALAEIGTELRSLYP